MAVEKQDVVRLQQLIGLCEYHAKKASDKHDFFVVKSTASYRQQAAKNSLEWAELFADTAQALLRLLTIDYTDKEL